MWNSQEDTYTTLCYLSSCVSSFNIFCTEHLSYRLCFNFVMLVQAWTVPKGKGKKNILHSFSLHISLILSFKYHCQNMPSTPIILHAWSKKSEKPTYEPQIPAYTPFELRSHFQIKHTRSLA